jgi:serine/threonine-protein kinase HipA
LIDFSQRLLSLDVETDGQMAGKRTRASQYEFAYGRENAKAVSLLMPISDRVFSDGALFAVMDMNLPEGFLLTRIRERSPKAVPSKMHL